MSEEFIVISDDYAVVQMGRFEFYYGYEHTICEHGNDCTLDSCESKEWAFVASENNKEVGRLTAKQMGMDQFDQIEKILLTGMSRFGQARFIKGES